MVSHNSAADDSTTDSSASQALCTLVVTDLVDSTKLVTRLGDRRALELGMRHDQLARRLLAKHDGQEIDKSDGFLILFQRTIGAVGFALDYHAGLAELSAAEGIDLRTRVGIHLGEVYLHENPAEEVAKGAKPVEVEGLAKIAAARLMGLAEGGQTLLTRGAFDIAHRASADDVAAANGLEWLSHGHYQLKGMDEPTEVCEVGALGTAPLTPPADTEKAVRVASPDSTSTFEVVKQRPTLLLAALLLVVAGVLAGLGAMMVRSREPAAPPPASAVAVLATAIRGEDTGDDVELLAYTIRDSLTRALTAFEGLAPKATSEVDAVSGPPTLVAKAVGADDVLESALTCRGRDCFVDLRRVRGSDGNVERSHSLDVPAGELLTAARATGVGLRQLYPEKSLRPGHGELEVSSEDYTGFVEIKRSFEERAETGEIVSLLDRLETLRRRSPRFAEAYRFEAGIAFFRYLRTQEEVLLARALELMREGEALAPGDPGFLVTRLYIETNSGRLDEAEQTLDALERLAPGDVRILDYRAQLLKERGLNSEALELATAALERRPSWRRFDYHASLALSLGEVGAARVSLEQLLKLHPDNALGKARLAELELINGDPRHAVELYSHLVARDPTAPRLSRLGLAYMLQGDYTASASAFERAITGTPDEPAYLLNLADVRWLQGRTEEAETLYRQVTELVAEQPVSAQSLIRLAQARAHLGAHREAVAAAQRALQLAPQDKWLAFEAALVYAVVGDHTGAVVNAERAIELGFKPRWFRLPWFDALRARPDFAELVATG